MRSVSIPFDFDLDSKGQDCGRTLVVIVHGWLGSPAGLAGVGAAAREALANSAGVDLLIPELPYARWYSLTSPTDVTAQLLGQIDWLCEQPDRYAHIYLVGHSMGAVIARRLFLIAAGMNDAVPSELGLARERARPWAEKVRRIVMLAGLDRGWVRSGRLGWLESAVTTIVAAAGHGWPGTRAPTPFHFRRGSPFIVHTRLQWLALQRDKARPKPLMIQLLGTQDNLVGPDDAVDFAVDATGSGSYLYLELPHTMHADATLFVANRRDPSGRYGRLRREKFMAALAADHGTLQRCSIDREFLADTLPPPPDESVHHTVFVMHGIRDDGFWTRRIAQRISEAAARHEKPVRTYRSITSSYGYFAMLPFIWPWIRREKVEWLMDEYVGAVARYPLAEFSYVGHSNGTYLVARALQDYPALRLRNLLFAGSVVRGDYCWRPLLAGGRVRSVVNMISTADWVVALFPTGLEPLRAFDLGGAGFRGFRPANASGLHEVGYVVGGHSAALGEALWTRIADFIVNDIVPDIPDTDYRPRQRAFWKAASKMASPLLITIILVFGVAPLYGLLRFGYSFAAFAYMLLLWFVVTRI